MIPINASPILCIGHNFPHARLLVQLLLGFSVTITLCRSLLTVEALGSGDFGVAVAAGLSAEDWAETVVKVRSADSLTNKR